MFKMVDFLKLKKTALKKAHFVIGFFFILSSTIHAQDQRKADSLEGVYNSGSFEEKNRMQLLLDLAYEQPDPDRSCYTAKNFMTWPLH